MTKRKVQTEEVKVPARRRENGFLSCDTCRFTIPYAGFDDGVDEGRPTHRCTDSVRPFTRFTLKEPFSIIRKLPPL